MTDEDLKDRRDKLEMDRRDKLERERAEIDARNGWEDVDLTDDSIDDYEDDEPDYTMVLNPDGTRTKIPRVRQKKSENKILTIH